MAPFMPLASGVPQSILVFGLFVSHTRGDFQSELRSQCFWKVLEALSIYAAYTCRGKVETKIM
jgi:hypothetical protein